MSGRDGRVSRVVKGSTRPMVESSQANQRTEGLLRQIDEHQREQEMQRMEIHRLREQIRLLVVAQQQGLNGGLPFMSPAGGAGSGAEPSNWSAPPTEEPSKELSISVPGSQAEG